MPSKVKLFLWRFARGSIPTAELLHHRNMSTTSTCVFCGARDSWRHAFLECPMASSVWALSDDALVEHMSQHDGENARE